LPAAARALPLPAPPHPPRRAVIVALGSATWWWTRGAATTMTSLGRADDLDWRLTEETRPAGSRSGLLRCRPSRRCWVRLPGPLTGGLLCRSPRTALQPAVVVGAPRGIGQHRVGFVDQRASVVIPSQVGVLLHLEHQRGVARFDDGQRGVGLDVQNPVVIPAVFHEDSRRRTLRQSACCTRCNRLMPFNDAGDAGARAISDCGILTTRRATIRFLT
jgi:hypothetical protein